MASFQADMGFLFLGWEPPMSGLEVADLDATREHLVEAGCAIEEDRAPIEGVRRLYVRDPARNRLEILERL